MFDHISLFIISISTESKHIKLLIYKLKVLLSFHACHVHMLTIFAGTKGLLNKGLGASGLRGPEPKC